METEEKIQQLFEKALGLPFGDERVHLFKEAVRLSDEAQNRQFSFFSRIGLCDAAVFSGYSELLLIHFPWLEAASLEDPVQFPADEYKWMYSWMVIIMSYAPEISRDIIERVMAKLLQVFDESGRTHRTALEIERTVAVLLGDKARAKDLQAAYELTDLPSEMAILFGAANHPAIELHNEGFFYQRMGNHEKALKILERVTSREVYFELSFPYSISAALNSQMHLGLAEAAKETFHTGLRLIRGQKKYKNLQPEFLTYLALYGKPEEAVAFLERHILNWEQSRLGQERLDYFRSAAILMRELNRQGIDSISVQLPEIHPDFRADGRYPTPVLQTAYEKRGADLAQAFNRRNDNEFYSQTWASSLAIGK